jgi:NAD(P)-dependent dehydrogenase (short-subunit alcohol dehydrogenase family)
MKDFSGKVALVTGAAGDIGAATARAFITAGAVVVLTAIKPKPKKWRRCSPRCIANSGAWTQPL